MNNKEFREILRQLEGDWRDFWIAVGFALVIVLCIFMVAIVALGVWL